MTTAPPIWRCHYRGRFDRGGDVDPWGVAPPSVGAPASSAALPYGIESATGVLNAAIFELEVLADSSNIAEADAVDPELFDHVQHLIEKEQWGQVASQACIFTEN